jgi:hypothetical protein
MVLEVYPPDAPVLRGIVSEEGLEPGDKAADPFNRTGNIACLPARRTYLESEYTSGRANGLGFTIQAR